MNNESILSVGSPENDEEVEDLLCLDLTHEEIKAAFRYIGFLKLI